MKLRNSLLGICLLLFLSVAVYAGGETCECNSPANGTHDPKEKVIYIPCGGNINWYLQIFIHNEISPPEHTSALAGITGDMYPPGPYILQHDLWGWYAWYSDDLSGGAYAFSGGTIRLITDCNNYKGGGGAQASASVWW